MSVPDGMDEAGCLQEVLFGAREHFCEAWLLGASAVSVLPCTGGRTAERTLGFVGLFHTGSRLCVTDSETDQGDTGGHTVGSDQ